ncbi:MAG: hypothetical protein WCX31_06345 [Salinivirgaceae bacterium]|jgi:hypothetical protein
MMRLTIFLIFVLLGVNSNAQKCFEFQKEHCQPAPSKFTYQTNNNSAAYKFSAGELRRIPFGLMENKDYRITLCGDSVFNGIILFVIQDESGKEIYNNSQHSFALNLEFSAKKSQEVNFDITIPDNTNVPADSLSVEGCVGILIEEMSTIKTGF